MVYDEYFNNVSLLLPMNGINNGTTFTDYSLIPKEITRFGDTKTVTAQSKYYGSSGYFDGNGDYLTAPSSADLQFGGGDFTIEAWVYFTGAPPSGMAATIACKYGNGTVSDAEWWFYVAYSSGQYSTIYLAVLNGNTFAAISHPFGAISLNAWHHIAVSREGNTGRLFLNGIVSTDKSITWPVNITTTLLKVGAFGSINDHRFLGHIQDLRITKGVARYTSNFTPPEKFAGKLAGTVLTDTNIGADSVIIRRWSNKEHREIITPNIATGVWGSNFLGNDKYDITYLAEGCAPQIHGPYIPE